MVTEPGIQSSSEIPGRAALLVIDVQQGLFQKSTSLYKADELLSTINGLIERAHDAAAPVFFVQHCSDKVLPRGSSEWQLHPELQVGDTDRIVEKTRGNAFENTELDATLTAQNIRCVVITGLVTHGCVRATCVGAQRLGYLAVLVADGHSSYSKDAARLIEEWNRKLSQGTADLQMASDVRFEK